MQAQVCSNYLEKQTMTKTNIDTEYLGADTVLTPEIIDFFALESEIKTQQQACIPDSNAVKLDEHELAMAE